ncbi:MAG: tRNA (adenosine(37)-N6)-threonylcarbamoyltransferase complex dimerization subunit type 1 TsaB [Actinomycetaceae bacterium]|nr:tRNA (adenosine(37)-N6)-threonylcarbamoyltransferase complex dimerization subunit type 1 TsaB [Actinomycetaceae bacterium]MDU0970641.1 tRNA (adenosine(37)-N6)-threonylcarbamoyltransferase complex dimerization subunit type 1 TsaB [Actinomycetaceae bacterium]
MRYLCIDTSAGASVALVDSESPTPLACGAMDNPRAHAEELTPLVTRVVADAGFDTLADAGIGRVAVGTGPAPFTGLRAGLVTARTIAWGLGVDVVGVPSIEALARAVLDLVEPGRHVVILTDARRKEVYAGRYRAAGASGVECLWGPEVGRAADLARGFNVDDLIAGPGAQLYAENFSSIMAQPAAVDAANLARIAEARLSQGATPSDLGTEPLYLRRPDVHVPGKR